jgi:hypothetical protein
VRAYAQQASRALQVVVADKMLPAFQCGGALSPTSPGYRHGLS